MVMVKTRNTLFDLGQTGEMGTATEEEDPNSSGILLHGNYFGCVPQIPQLIRPNPGMKSTIYHSSTPNHQRRLY